MKYLVWMSLLFSFSPVYIGDVYAQGKMGYVDFQYLITQIQSVQDVQTELEKLSRDWTDRLSAMEDSVALIEKDYEALSITLTKSGKNVLEKNIADAKQKILVYREQKFSPVTGELYKKQQELLQPILDKVKRAIDNVRLKEKYDVVFDISTGNPVSIDKRFDLTLLVLEELPAVGLTTVQIEGRGTDSNLKAPGTNPANRTPSGRSSKGTTNETSKPVKENDSDPAIKDN
ncbi:OmpH family outer membrane protein [bacterium]|nr:OmpH family outer membrane protein [bacterium]NUN46587.1 OmpH family outer membrane protein [bacterium]